ncbi:hypothetical protein [Microbacterium sp. SORGH_AS_0888]|uniref:hypothetical protein n=1 Tax=Microbacterium sp. SORGH_AS_0888 TaxID=3041791 RepID=UPI00277F20BF|nr:hypothetical protein [Microbacterium sp. SORGH_AS_0888]MDQ1131034.1 hypothetical protein [Microbacterium sp. SORGH_AS_0888]
MRRGVLKRICGVVAVTSVAVLSILLPAAAASAAGEGAVPPDVQRAFSCDASATDSASELCAGVGHFGDPRPVYRMNQAYIDGASDDPVGEIDSWIAVAYDSDGKAFGTSSAFSPDGAWKRYGIDTRASFTDAIVSHAGDSFVELRITGRQFYAVGEGTIVGLNEPAAEIAPEPRSITEAQPDIAAAWALSATSFTQNQLPESTGAGPVIAVTVFGALVVGAFIFFVLREPRPRPRPSATP